jgi:hypothetical protein
MSVEAVFKFESADECPDRKSRHAPAPQGYIERYDWMKEMMKTHDQKRCPTCGFYAVWVPKKAVAEEPQ